LTKSFTVENRDLIERKIIHGLIFLENEDVDPNQNKNDQATQNKNSTSRKTISDESQKESELSNKVHFPSSIQETTFSKTLRKRDNPHQNDQPTNTRKLRRRIENESESNQNTNLNYLSTSSSHLAISRTGGNSNPKNSSSKVPSFPPSKDSNKNSNSNHNQLNQIPLFTKSSKEFPVVQKDFIHDLFKVSFLFLFFPSYFFLFLSI